MKFFGHHFAPKAQLGSHFSRIDGPFRRQQFKSLDLFNMTEIAVVFIHDLPVKGQYPRIADQFFIGAIRGDVVLFGPCP